MIFILAFIMDNITLASVQYYFVFYNFAAIRVPYLKYEYLL